MNESRDLHQQCDDVILKGDEGGAEQGSSLERDTQVVAERKLRFSFLVEIYLQHNFYNLVFTSYTKFYTALVMQNGKSTTGRFRTKTSNMASVYSVF